jgi:hypothetical protein
MKTKKIFHVFVFVVTMLGISQYAQAQENTLSKRFYLQLGATRHHETVHGRYGIRPHGFYPINGSYLTFGYIVGRASLLFRSYHPNSIGSIEWNSIRPTQGDRTIGVFYTERLPVRHSNNSPYIGLGIGTTTTYTISAVRFVSTVGIGQLGFNLFLGKPITKSLTLEAGYQDAGGYQYHSSVPKTHIRNFKLVAGYRF